MIEKLLIVCLLSNLSCVLAECIEAENVVKTTNGCLEGEVRKNYLAFEGIRYAEPPLGENRFEPPKPYAETWTGVQNATKIGPMCLQRNLFKGYKLEGEEDCLFLNVYKPEKDSSEEGNSLPVLVHIFGGGFMYGDASFYGHKHIMKEGKFIYVSFNYRLGPLGFLSTNCHLVPGNMGLKDQVLALKWVQQNIRAFGGNPNSITLSGFSAGAASVHMHYMSPLSEGLFHRGISHSGCALNDWVMMEKPFDMTLSLAKKLNCPHASHQEIVQCLKEQKASDLVKFGGMFAAVKEIAHDDAFITDTPVNYLKNGRIQKLPWLVSATKDDGAVFLANAYPNETYWETMNEHWSEKIAELLQFPAVSEEIKEKVAEKLKQHYLKGEPLTKANALQIGKIVTDRGFFLGISESIALQGKLAPVYFYLYKFKLSVGLRALSIKTNDDLGVVHGDDVVLIYNTPVHAGDFQHTEDEKKMTEELLEMYESFSKEAIPKFNDVVLTRSIDKLEYSDIVGPESIVTDRNNPLCDVEFWRDIQNDFRAV